MSLTVLLAVLGAAFLHALWNALVRGGGDPAGRMFILNLLSAPIGLAVALTRPMPAMEMLPWLAAAVVAHTAYKYFLISAYEVGDLSRVYPLARGAAPLLAALVGALLLADTVGPLQYLGITVLGLGILTMARGVFTDGESRRMLPFALASAAATASYTLIDGMGGRIAGDSIAYVGWLFVADGLVFSAVMIATRGWGLMRGGWGAWGPSIAGSAASFGAYAIAVWAMTRAPIAVVAALRETSILFAVLIGWLIFGERMTTSKALAAGLIIVGVMLMRL